MEQPAPTGPDAADEVDALLASVEPLFEDGIAAFAYNVAELELEKLTAALGRLEGIRERGNADGTRVDAAMAALMERKKRVIDCLRMLWRIRGYLAGDREQIVPLQLAPMKGKPNSKSSRVRDRVVAILQESGPIHRSDILKRLLADGLLGTERKPMNRLASILAANHTLFGSDGRGTYFLITPEHTEQRQTTKQFGLSGPRRPALPASQLEQGGEGHAGACAA